MTSYKIEVTEYGEKQGEDRYPPSKTVYTQLVEFLDLAAVIATVNSLVDKHDPLEKHPYYCLQHGGHLRGSPACELADQRQLK